MGRTVMLEISELFYAYAELQCEPDENHSAEGYLAGLLNMAILRDMDTTVGLADVPKPDHLVILWHARSDGEIVRALPGYEPIRLTHHVPAHRNGSQQMQSEDDLDDDIPF